MKKFPQIKASFVIEGKKIDPQKITEELNILPTETRGIEDWPEAIRGDSNLPEELHPRYVWCICQKLDLCRQVAIPVEKIVTQIRGKEQKILELCEKECLKRSLCITIHAEPMNLPEMVLPSHVVSYFGKLEVEIGFDIYIY